MRRLKGLFLSEVYATVGGDAIDCGRRGWGAEERRCCCKEGENYCRGIMVKGVEGEEEENPPGSVVQQSVEYYCVV